MPIEDLQVYGRIGEAGFERLVAAFYRQIPGDDLLGPMYPKEDLAGAELRLREFLIQRFGGPTRYSDQRGHPRLRMRHGPFPIDSAARDRWMELMGRAFEEVKFEPDVDALLRSFFANTATFMINRNG
jgi:hemoglobin